MLKHDDALDTVDLTFEAPSANSYIKYYANTEGPLEVFGNPDLKRINPSFLIKESGATCHISFHLHEFNSYELSEEFSFVMTPQRKTREKGEYWKLLLDNQTIYKLRLKYGLGNTHVNLSQLHVKHLDLRTGSANVLLTYDEQTRNLTAMDTFRVKVDVGSITTENLSASRAKFVVADIGFGNATLDFGNQMPEEKCTIVAKVGAGSLEIVVPNKETPVIITIKNSPFCGLNMDAEFEEVEKNVFVNHSYHKNAENLLEFRVDLAVGKLYCHFSD